MGGGGQPQERSERQTAVALGLDRSPNAAMRRAAKQQRRPDGLLLGTTHSMPQGATPGSGARAAAAIEAAAAPETPRQLSLEPVRCEHCGTQGSSHELQSQVDQLKAQLAAAWAELATARAQGFGGGSGGDGGSDAPPSIPLSAEGVPPATSSLPDGSALRISGAAHHAEANGCYAELSEREGGRPVYSKLGGGGVRIYFANYCSQWRIDARRPRAAEDLSCYVHDERSMRRPPEVGWLQPNTRTAEAGMRVQWLKKETGESFPAEQQTSRPF
jgi:hypothetical protein